MRKLASLLAATAGAIVILAILSLQATAQATPGGPTTNPAGPVDMVRADGSSWRSLPKHKADGTWYVIDPKAAVKGKVSIPGFPAGTAMASIPSSARSGAKSKTGYAMPPISCHVGVVLCIYKDAKFGGATLIVTPGAQARNFTQLTCFGCNRYNNWNDVMSSWSNQTKITYWWYFNIDGRGEAHRMRTGVWQGSLPKRENNKASGVGY
jgi:hypothetical protein